MWKRFSDLCGLRQPRRRCVVGARDAGRVASESRATQAWRVRTTRSPGDEARWNTGFAPTAGGFTLIEMMLVVGIMGIILSFGLPAMVRVLEREPLRQAVADTVEGLSHARAQAILQGRPSEWVISGDYKISVRVTPEPSPETTVPEIPPWMPPPEPTERTEESPGGPIFEAQLGEDVMVTSIRVNGGPNLVLLPDAQMAVVRFYPNGTSDDFEMDLQDLKHARQITLDPVTGFADVVTTR